MTGPWGLTEGVVLVRERPGCDREVLKKGMSDSPQGLKEKRFEDCEQSGEKMEV